MKINPSILADLQAELDRGLSLHPDNPALETADAVSIIQEQLLQLQRAADHDCPEQAYRQGVQVAAVAINYLQGLEKCHATFRN